MSTAASAARRLAPLRRALLAWFDAERRDLPWRRTRDAYHVWLSEIMLQQTRVETVTPYYERFVQRFPTLGALAAAPLDDVLLLWAGLGYYSRARNMHRAAQAVAAEHAGRLPPTAAQLQSLPGVGRYTAAAVASIAFDEPVAVLDGNVKRVLARFHADRTPIDQPAAVKRLWTKAQELLCRRRPGDFNQALMELGATVCTPRRPLCGQCPLQRACRGHALRLTDRLPVVSPRKESPRLRRLAAAVWRSGRLLAVQRPARGLLGGLWELPGCAGGGADEPAALRAALASDFGISARMGKALGEVEHVFTHRVLRVSVFSARATRTRAGHATLSRHVAAQWVSRAELDQLAWAALDRKVLALAVG